MAARSPFTRRLLWLLAFLAAGLPGTTRAAQVTASWIGPPGGTWSNPSNWSPSGVPQNNTPPGVTYRVEIDSGGGVGSRLLGGSFDVVLDVNAVIDELLIGSSDRLTVANARALTIAGTLIDNQGDLALGSTGNITDLKIAGRNVLLTGGGTVTMSASTANRILGMAGNELLVNDDNYIHGSGQVGANALSLTNRGDIGAETGDNLTVDPGAGGCVNAGFLFAGGGTLTLLGGTYANTEGAALGHIRADGSMVDLSGATVMGGIAIVIGAGQIRMTNSSILGGTLINSATGTIRSLSATNTIGGAVNNPLGGQIVVENASTLVLVGAGSAFTNAGSFLLQSTGNITDLRIQGDVTLQGGGGVTCSGSTANRILGTAATDRLTNEDHVFTGSGQIGANNMALTNRGQIVAGAGHDLTIDPSAGGAVNAGTLAATGGGKLTLGGGAYANVEGPQNGLIRCNGSTLDLSGATVTGGAADVVAAGQMRLSSSSLTGGTLTNSSTGTIRSQSAANTIGGTVTNPLGGQLVVDNASTLILLAGTYTNAGTILLQSTGNITDLRISGGDVTLQGGGSVALSGSTANRILGSTGTDRLINQDNTIAGSGQIGANVMALTNRGTVEAGAGADLTLDPSATGFVNAGTMRATGGGKLTLGGGTYANLEGVDDGLVRSDASTVELNGATVTGGDVEVVGAGQLRLTNAGATGGRLTNSGTGAIRSVSATNTIGGIVSNPLGGLLTVENASALVLVGAGGSFTNAGSILLQSTGNITDLRIQGDVTLTGGGGVTLSTSTANRILGTASTDRLVNQDNTISGSGQLGANVMALTNRGTVQAAAGQDLTVDPSGSGVVNAGTMRATGGGTLALTGGAYANLEGPQNGLIRCDASNLDVTSATVTGGAVDVVGTGQLDLSNASITGGTLANSATGTIRSASATNTIGGAFTNPAGGVVNVLNASALVLSGAGSTFSNAGTINILSTGNITDLRISGGDVALTGGGDVVMSANGANRILGTAPTDRLVNQDNTISGSGGLGANTMGIVNQGEIHANQAVALSIDVSAAGFTSSGVVRVAAGSTLNLSDPLAQTGGTTTVDGTLSGGSVSLSGGELNGDGAVTGPVTATGGTVAPGKSPGSLGTGNLSLSAASTFEAELDGTAAGTGYDELAVTGTVSLGGATLNVVTGFAPSAGTAFAILVNDGGDAIAGTFNGLPQGTSFTAGGTQYTISYTGGSGNDVVLTVSGGGGAASTTALSSAPNPSVFGETVTFTATVSGAAGTPTGTVTFKEGGSTLGSATLVSGQASLPLSSLGVGAHTITAEYGGDATYLAGTSAPATQNVNRAATSTVVVSSENPSGAGSAVTFTATVSASAPGAGTPTGTVTFKDGAATLGTGTLSGRQASFPTSSLGVGSHPITAEYGGDANFTSSTSPGVVQVVEAGPLASFLVEAAGGGNIPPQMAGTPFNVRITARDALGNVVTDFGANVLITSNGALSGAPVASGTFVAGVLASQSVTISAAQNGVTLTATEPESTASGTSNAFNVSPASAVNFLVEAGAGGAIPPQTAGTAFPVRVTARDPHGATVPTFTGTVNLTTNAGTINPTNLVFLASDNGVRTVNVTLDQAGTSRTITATDPGSGGTGTSNAFTVNPGGVASFLVESAAGGSIPPQVAGTPFGLRVTARDGLGNVATGFTGTVNLATNAGPISPTSVSFQSGDNGVKTVNVTLTLSGTARTVTATDPGSGGTGTSNAFTVNPGTVASFLVESAAGGTIPSQTEGIAFGIRVTARDGFGNVATGFVGTANLTVNAGSIAPASTPFGAGDGGVKTLSVTLSPAGTGRTITATDPVSASAGTSNAFDVTSVVVLAPDLSIFKSHAGSFRVGSQGVYTIRVTNAVAAGPTTGLITVVDDLPAGLPFVSASGGGFTCTPSALRVTCTRAAALAPGASALISLTVGATSVAVPQVVNTVAVATAGDLNTGNDVATDPTDVLPAVDFNLVLDPAELTVLAGGEDGNLTVGIAAATGVYNVAFASLPDINVFPPSFLLSGGASRSVLVSAESPAAAGTFSLLVTATEITTSRVKTAFLRLTVTRPAPDFTLSVSPASTSLRPGGDPASLTVTATPANGFTGTVSVTAPALANVTFTPASFDLSLPGGPVSRTITVAAGLDAAPGTSSSVFTGTGGGLTRTAPLDVAVEALPPVIDTFTASPTSIASGQTSTLSWTSRFATSARIDPGVGGVPASGTTVVSPSATLTYTLTVTGPGGSATAQASVRVCVAPSAPGAATITSLGSPQAPVTGVDELLLSWLAPASGEPPSRYEYRVNGEPYASTAQTSAEAAPRGDASPIQLFVRAYACSPERGPSAETASPVYSLAPPVADFTAPATAAVNQSITLTDTSFPQATSWLWLYDDGTPPGTTQTQNHIFRTAGAHDVILVAINGSGTSIKTRTVNVTASASAPAPALALRAFDEPEGERRRLHKVSLAPGRSTRLLVAADAAGSADEVPVFLRFLDSRGRLVRERRLAVPPGPESAFDISGMAPQGVYTLELVAGVPLRAWVEEPTLAVRDGDAAAPRRRDLPAPIYP